MHDTKEQSSLLWIFALFNYLYADVVALFAIVGSQGPVPHLTRNGLCWQRCLAQNRLRRGVFRALEEFIMAIEDYFNRHNENPERFI